MKKFLLPYAFWFATLFGGVFLGAATVDVLYQDASIEMIMPAPPPAGGTFPDDFIVTNYNCEPVRLRPTAYGTSVGVNNPGDCLAALCIGPLGWGLDMDNIGIYFDTKAQRVHMYANTDEGIGWAKDNDKDLTTAPVAADHLYVEPEYGVKLLVKYVIAEDGSVERDIYAFPSKEEIYGDTNKRTNAIARSAANAAGQRP